MIYRQLRSELRYVKELVLSIEIISSFVPRLNKLVLSLKRVLHSVYTINQTVKKNTLNS